ncbi:MAG TPA: hypothetical protein VN285_10150 [Candidatus Deferrimicrobium sp.]|nr:hypothetical protein [Candidatus Deferrimicrobium sp.]
MEITARVVRQVVLLSLLFLIVPMILFPERLGTPLAHVSLLNAAYEFLFYTAVAFLVYRGNSLPRLASIAAFCLVYRLALGAAFGILVVIMYSMSATIALRLGMFSYLPAVLMHIAATPWMLRPILSQIGISPRARRSPTDEWTTSEVPEPGSGTSEVVLREAKRPAFESDGLRETPRGREQRGDLAALLPHVDGGGFDRAVHYIGEDSSVQVAVVVDPEGLPLGRFARGAASAEDWAPLGLILSEANRQPLQRAGLGVPDRMDLVVRETRVIVAREEGWLLLVVAYRHADDFLNIRINQGLEMIRKYMFQRYGVKPSVGAEKSYV